MNLEKITKRQEECFKKSTWFMLQKIQKKLNEGITDTINLLLSDGESSPSKTTQRSTLMFLEKTNSLSIQQKFYSKHSIAHIFYRLENITGSAKNKPQLYRMKIHEKHFSKTYDFYKQLYEKYDYARFNKKSKVLTLDGKNVVFSRKSYYLLSALFFEKDEYYTAGNLLDLKTANEFIAQVDPAESLSDRSFYSTRDYINEKILKKTDAHNFLLLEDGCVKVNEKYLYR